MKKKISQPQFTPQGTRKQNMSKVSKRKEITKIKVKINEIDAK